MERKLFRFKRIQAQIRLFLPIAFLIFALILIVLGVSDSPFLVKTRKVVIEGLIPVVRVIQAPVYWLKGGVEKVKNWSLTYQQNELLRQENAELLKWQAKSFELESKVNEYEKLLKYIPPKKSKSLTVDILLDEGGAFSRSYIVGAGEAEGVVKGMLGFGPKALAGRIIEVGEHHSFFMSLTDYMSRIPVWVGSDKKSAFLIGDNTEMPVLQLVQSDVPVQPGDIVLTSGYVGLYPANLLIGFVESVDEDEARVHLYENTRSLSVVRLVDFGLTKNALLGKEE